MIDEPQVAETSKQNTAVIKLQIPHEKMQEVMGPAIGELLSTLQNLGVKPQGPLFSHHYRIDPEVFDFEIGVPVENLVMPSGRVEPSELPARRIARTIYHGPYEGLDAAWTEFDNWITTAGHEMDGSLWERYVAGPEVGDDASEWQTELVRPLK